MGGARRRGPVVAEVEGHGGVEGSRRGRAQELEEHGRAPGRVGPDGGFEVGGRGGGREGAEG